MTLLAMLHEADKTCQAIRATALHQTGSQYYGTATSSSDWDFIAECAPYQELFSDMSKLGWLPCGGQYEKMASREVWEKLIGGEKINLILCYTVEEYSYMLAAARVVKYMAQRLDYKADKALCAVLHEAARGNPLYVK